MSKIPARVRRAVAIRECVIPGQETIVSCHYCPETAVATWPLNRDGTPSYWPLFGIGFGLDHVIPRALGGLDVSDNLVICCGRCNPSKRDRPAEQFRGHSRIECGGVPA